jgi:hypothetical protein
MIIATPLFPTKQITGLKQFARDFPQQSTAIVGEIFDRRVAPYAKKILTAVPPEHQHQKGEMTAKQNRWWWAVGIKNWKGRTGKLLRSYGVGVFVFEDEVSLSLKNKARHFKYTKGKRKQRMHIVWRPISEDLATIKAETDFALRDELPDKIREAAKRYVH